jgi:O-acetyl-ADP-ribose deacetylase (regulator of RNase III)
MCPSSVQIIHPDPNACEVMRERWHDIAAVEVVCGAFPLIPAADCFVTAGNSYGIMNAGIDAAVRARFGHGIMAAVQRVIVAEFFGEQPVGTALALRTNDRDFPVLIHAPTMRVPGSIAGTDAVYRATLASLVCAAKWSGLPIERIAFPAMGTGFGGVAFPECARQMRVAWEHFRNPPTMIGENWDFVLGRERAITTDRGRTVVR